MNLKKNKFSRVISVFLVLTFSLQQLAYGYIPARSRYENLSLDSALEQKGSQSVDGPNEDLTKKDLLEAAVKLGVVAGEVDRQAVTAALDQVRADFAAWDADHSTDTIDVRFQRLAELFTERMHGIRGRPELWMPALLDLARIELAATDSPLEAGLIEVATGEAMLNAEHIRDIMQRHGIVEAEAGAFNAILTGTRQVLTVEAERLHDVWEHEEGLAEVTAYDKEIKLIPLLNTFGLTRFPGTWTEVYTKKVIVEALNRDPNEPLCRALTMTTALTRAGQAFDADEIFTQEVIEQAGDPSDWTLFNKALVGGSGCGILSFFGRRGSILAVLEAADRLSYRAPDSTGVAKITEDGDIVIMRKLRTPEYLVQHMYWHSLHQEHTVLADPPSAGEIPVVSLAPAQLDERRRQLHERQGIDGGTLRDLSFAPEVSAESALYTSDNLYGHYASGRPVSAGQVVSVGVGDVGNSAATQSYVLDAEMNVTRMLRRRYGFSSKMLKIQLVEAFKQSMANHPDYATDVETLAANIALYKKIAAGKAEDTLGQEGPKWRQASIDMENFIRIVSKVMAGSLDAKDTDKSIWHALWHKFIRSNKVIISPDYDIDCVRHVFRLLASNITASMDVWPYIEEEVQGRFAAEVGGTDIEGTQWRDSWRQEIALNTPGVAFKVLVEHFQDANIPTKFHDKVDRGRVGGITLELLVEMASGHGRWGMIGGITEVNAHPHRDFKGNRVVVHNGALDQTSVFPTLRREQREAGYIHRSETDTEVVAFEWEKTFDEERAKGHEISDADAFRMACRRMKPGSELAVDAMSKYSPRVRYVVSYNRPVAIVIKDGDVMISSDVNAALGLWPSPDVEEAVREITTINARAKRAEQTLRKAKTGVELDRRLKTIRQATEKKIAAITKGFGAEAIFLEGGEQGDFATVYKAVNHETGEVEIRVDVTDFDGIPVEEVKREAIEINPAQIGKGDSPTFIEFHIDEIPRILRKNIETCITPDGRVNMDSAWQEVGMKDEEIDRLTALAEQGDIIAQGTLRAAGHRTLLKAGLNMQDLKGRFGENLEHMERFVLIGVGSSFRDALAAKAFYETILPDHVNVVIYDPVELLNKGVKLNPETDLAVEITWSGSTASIKKADAYCEERDVFRLGVTGKIQSDVARMTRNSGGAIDVQSGPEISVCTVKGFEAILEVLMLLGLQMAQTMNPGESYDKEIATLRSIPDMVEDELESPDKEAFFERQGERFKDFTKVAALGTQPVDLEGELKMEEVNWIVAQAFDPSDASFWTLVEKNADKEDKHNVMIMVNMTDETRLDEQMAALRRLQRIPGAKVMVKTYTHGHLNEVIGLLGKDNVYVGHKVEGPMQALLDAVFYFRMAVALADAKGIPDEGDPSKDKCRNLTKSVVVTGAEAEAAAKSAGAEFNIMPISTFVATPWADVIEEPADWFTRQSFDTTDERIIAGQSLDAREILGTLMDGENITLRGVNTDNLQARFGENLRDLKEVVLLIDEEVTENAALAAKEAFEKNLGISVRLHRTTTSADKDLALKINPNNMLVVGIGRSTRSYGKRGAVSGYMRALATRGVAVLSISDSEYRHARRSGAESSGSVSLGIPARLDDLSFYETSYFHLAALSAELAKIKGEDVSGFVAGLRATANNIAKVVQDDELRSGIREVAEQFKGYDKGHALGGGQAFATVSEMSRAFRGRGFFLEPQYNDSAWHGPLAIIENTEKGPDYDESRDGLIFIVTSDSNFYSSCLMDSQVYHTRRANIVLVVQEGDEDIEGVNNVGATKILKIPKAPDMLVNPSDAVFAHIMALEFAKAKDEYTTALVRGPDVPPGGPIERVPDDVANELNKRTAVLESNEQAAIFDAYGVVRTQPADKRSVEVRVVPWESDEGSKQTKDNSDVPEVATSIIIAASPDMPGILGDVGYALAHKGLNCVTVYDQTFEEPGVGETSLLRAVVEAPYQHVKACNVVGEIKSRLVLPDEITSLACGAAPHSADLADEQYRALLGTCISYAAAVASTDAIGLVPQELRDRFNLVDQVRKRLRKKLCPELTRHMALTSQQMALFMGTDTRTRRSFKIGDCLVNSMDGIRSAITDSPGSVGYIVHGEVVDKMGDIPEDWCAADVLAAHIPEKERVAEENAQVLMNPNRSGEDLRETLEYIARANKCALSNLRVVVSSRPREIARIDELRRLGVQVKVLSLGESTFPHIVKACLPPQEGEPVDVVLSVNYSHQAFSALALTNGLEGSWVSFNLVSTNVNDEEQFTEQGMPYAVGFGGALAFTESEVDGIRQLVSTWQLRGLRGTVEDMRKAEFLFTPELVRDGEPTSAVIIPVTDMDVIQYSPEGESVPIPGISVADGTAVLHTLHLRKGKVWVGRAEQNMDEFAVPDGVREASEQVLAMVRPRETTEENGRGYPGIVEDDSGEKTDRMPQPIAEGLIAFGLEPDTIDSMSRALMRSDRDGQMRGSKSVMKLVAAWKKKTYRDMVYEGLFHERVENILDLISEPDKKAQNITIRVMGMLRHQTGFLAEFSARFGTYDDDEMLADEVIAKYYSAKFRGDEEELELFKDVAPGIEGFLEMLGMNYNDQQIARLFDSMHISLPVNSDEQKKLFDVARTILPSNLHECFDISSRGQLNRVALLAALRESYPNDIARQFNVDYLRQLIGSEATDERGRKIGDPFFSFNEALAIQAKPYELSQTNMPNDTLKIRQIMRVAKIFGAPTKIEFDDDSAYANQIDTAMRNVVKAEHPELDGMITPVLDGSSDKVNQLKKQGVLIMGSVYIAPEVDISEFRDGIIYPGTIILGKTKIGRGCVVGGKVVDVTMRDFSTIANTNPEEEVVERTILQSHAHIGKASVSDYTLGANSTVTNTPLKMEGETSFGNGAEIEVGPEVGGVGIPVYAGMSYHDVEVLARNIGNDDIWKRYRDKAASEKAKATSTKGRVGRGAVIIGATEVTNANIGPGAQLINPGVIRNATILSQEDEQTVVKEGASVKNGILQQGVKLAGQATFAENTMMFEHSTAENGAQLSDCITAPNCSLEKSEFLASLMGPFFTSHHKKSLVIGVIAVDGMDNLGAGCTGSNHGGRRPDHTLRLGKCQFFGIDSRIGIGSDVDLSDSPLSFFAADINILGEQTLRLPATLFSPKRPRGLTKDAQAKATALQVSNFNLAEPGFVDPYFLAFSGDKYASRDKSKRHNFDFELFNAETIDQIVDARARLQAAMENARKTEQSTRRKVELFLSEEGLGDEKKSSRRLEEEREDGYGHVSGLGKNYMTREGLENGIVVYDRMIRRYALKALQEEIVRARDRGRETWGEVIEHLTFKDSRAKPKPGTPEAVWVHARGVLESQLGVDLAHLSEIETCVLLQRAAGTENLRYDAIYRSRDRDRKSASAIFGKAYADEVFNPTEMEKFLSTKAGPEKDEFVQTSGQIIGGLRTSGVSIPDILRYTRISDALTPNEDTNIGSLRALTRGEDMKNVEDNILGLGLSAQFIMQNAGVREALEELASSGEATGINHVVLVTAETEEEKRVIEAMELPLVEVVMLEGEDKKEQVANLMAQFEARGLGEKLRHQIGLIENPTDNMDEAIRELEEATAGLEVYVGIPPTPQQGQLLSAHGVFHNIIEAIASRRGLAQRVFAIRLPAIEIPSENLRQRFEEYLEAIEFLKNA